MRVGVVTNNRELDDGYALTGTGQYELKALKDICGLTPIMLPACAGVISPEEAMELCDGFLFPGGRANVHPSHYNQPETEKHGPFNGCRDSLTLPLIRMAIEAGKPVLGICRGHQEINVALGGSLFAEVRDLPGRDNHRMPPEGTMDEKFALRHTLRLREGGILEEIFDGNPPQVNSLHGQAIDSLGAGVVVEAWAEDETIEAISVPSAKGFVLGLQWHPEYHAKSDPLSVRIFKRFGEAFSQRAEIAA